MFETCEVKLYESQGEYSFYDVSYDIEELKKIRKIIVDNLSIVEYHRHVAYQEPQYSSKQKYERFEIRHQSKSYLPGIDTWPLIECSYDKLVYPYIVRLLDKVLEGDEKDKKDAIAKLLEPTLPREYIPVQEMINEYSQVIVEGNMYNEANPGYRRNYPYEIDAARENIKKYTEILLNENYTNKFVDAYASIRDLLNIKKKDKDNKIKRIKL